MPQTGVAVWRQCPTAQDDPIYLPWGFQLQDGVMALGIFFFFFLVMHRPFSGATVALLVLGALRRMKKGKPPGMHWHWLHDQELFFSIPGARPPKNERLRIW
jgi:hypothetical protein